MWAAERRTGRDPLRRSPPLGNGRTLLATASLSLSWWVATASHEAARRSRMAATTKYGIPGLPVASVDTHEPPLRVQEGEASVGEVAVRGRLERSSHGLEGDLPECAPRIARRSPVGAPQPFPKRPKRTCAVLILPRLPSAV